MEINESQLLALAGDDRELVAEVVNDFREGSLGLVAQMKSALSEESEESLKGFLHQMKGSSGTLGMVTLFERCRDLEAEDLAFWDEKRFQELEEGIQKSAQLALNCLAG